MYRNGNSNRNDYSRLKICRAGRSYLEYVVPHFEFMLSRSDYNTNVMKTSLSPLFCANSVEICENDEFRFEKKIRKVFSIVKSCCMECSLFSSQVITAKGYSVEQYINSVFNYHTEGNDGSEGPKQCYESRLIFRHLGYIDKYRLYLLSNPYNCEKELLIKYNKILVSWIEKYLDLYSSGNYISFHTDEQDTAALVLMDCIENIKKNNYEDFTSPIDTTIQQR